MSEQINKLWELLSVVLQRDVFSKMNIMTKKEGDKVFLELRGEDQIFWAFLTFYVSESDIVTTKRAIYTNSPLVGKVSTLISEDEEYIFGLDDFSLGTALLAIDATMKELTEKYQKDEPFIYVGSTCGDLEAYNEIVYIDTVKRLLPFVDGLNRVIFVIKEGGVDFFAEINHMFFSGNYLYDKETSNLEKCVVKILDESAALTGIHLNNHDGIELLFKDRFSDVNVEWTHKNHLTAGEMSDEQSLIFEVLEEEENETYVF